MAERKELEESKRVLGALDHRLSRPPEGGYSTDEILGMMKAKTAELEKDSPRREPRPKRVWWPWLVAGAVAAVLAALLLMKSAPQPQPRQEIAPKEQKPSGKLLSAPPQP